MTARPGMPRLLAIMGSGETSPTMVRVHRQLLERLGPPPVPAVLLDTPFGFQENAREIAGRAVTYFRESLQATISVTGLAAATAPTGGAEQVAFADEQLMTAVRDSRYVFAGPGSPSYALRKWQGTAYRACSSRSSHTVVASCSRVPQPYARHLDGARVRDLQVRRGPALAPGPRRHLGGRDTGGDHPPLRQQRGRDARHPFLLPG